MAQPIPYISPNRYNNSIYFYFESIGKLDNNETVIYKEDFKNHLNKGATHNGSISIMKIGI